MTGRGRALLLDRDGVVNIDHAYVGTIERFEFQDGIFPLTRRAMDLGYRIVVVTNQSGIARGYYGEEDFARLTRWMCGVFAGEGVEIAAVLHCPFHRGGRVAAYARDSFWRKPAPGMILEAQRRLGLDLARSVFLGDQPTDMAAARAAGVGVKLLLDHGTTGAAVGDAAPDAVVATLAGALPYLEGQEGRGGGPLPPKPLTLTGQGQRPLV